MMKAVILLAVLGACVTASPLDDWLSFKQTHGKRYRNPSEEHYRMNIFMSNKKRIEEHNQKYEKGLVTFHLKMNHFGDLTRKEFNTLMNKYDRSRIHQKSHGSRFVAPANAAVPASIDWRDRGAVTPVKDQGECGSCWAFSTTGALEGQHFLKTGKLVSLSEQNLVDCAGDYGNDGCDGGLMDNAFRYVKENGGIDTEDSYPYEGVDADCRFNNATIGASASGYVDIPEGDEEALKTAVATIGPIAVAIDAGEGEFQFYAGGVYYESSCSTDYLNHGVLAVGYGTEDGKDYWLVKNSWNSNWGDDGYIKMARNKDNNCGIASSASYPLV